MIKLLKTPLFWIFILALLLRVYKLGAFPVGFHADEARVAWNAFSILKTGEDDRGNKLSLYYNTFGDFRPTGIFYVTIPSIALFGRNEFAVRFPAALLGALTVLPLFFLTNLTSKSKKLALFASFFLAINPWHLSISRATSEVIISLFIALWGLYFFIRAIHEKSTRFLIIGSLSLILSFFFYHSIRLSAPLFVGATILFYWKGLKNSNFLKSTLVALGVICLTTLLLISNKEARGRFSQVSIFNDLDVQYELTRMPFEEGPNRVFIARAFHNKPLTYTRRFINEYMKYFSSEFFLNSSVAKPGRYQTIGVGLLTYIEFGLLILGLIAIAQKKVSPLALALLLIAPIPGALTTEDAPNLHRALFMIPFLMIISAYGFNLLLSVKKKLNFLVLGLLILNLIFYLHMYYVHARVHIPLYRNIGAKELAIYLNEVQGNYDKIILSNIPDDPYPWIAFFTGKDPKVFNQDAITREKGTWTSENFMFTGLRCPSRDAFTVPDVKRLLVVDAEGCATESNLKERSDVTIIKRILRPDESEVYTLWSRIVEQNSSKPLNKIEQFGFTRKKRQV
ncbi:glycosyltransferase family 39 protein [Candidatus Woesebacteria bacterium]|nr:glycosyltransferase family 39 protein [Candidatus Woesebacteria bacterium]